MVRIFKFGGASVKDASAVRNLLMILKKEGLKNGVIVVSAMGKTTVALENMAEQAFKLEPYDESLQKILGYHARIQQELKISSSRFEEYTKSLRLSLKKRYQDKYAFQDLIISYGELFSTSIIEEFLSKEIPLKWLDARELICTNDAFGEAQVIWPETISRVKERILPGELCITQGFIGSSENGQTTTLGKEGSDYTAAILANCLDAESVTVWKDVPGILNADPKLMEETRRFDQLSYQEITEMTYYGAKVIHTKTMAPLAKKSIPLFVRSFLEPEAKGTVIHADDTLKVQIPTFIFKFNELVVTLRPKNNEFIDEEKLMRVFQVLKQNHIKINLMQNSALTFTFCFDFHEAKLNSIKAAFSKDFIFRYNNELHLATIKNYDKHSIEKLPRPKAIFIEQKSRSVFHRLYSI